MKNHSLLDQTFRNLLESTGVKLLRPEEISHGGAIFIPDYLFIKDNERIAIEIYAHLDESTASAFVAAISSMPLDTISHVILTASNELKLPPEQQYPEKIKIMSFAQFQKFLGIDNPLDLMDPATQSQVQGMALTKKFHEYKRQSEDAGDKESFLFLKSSTDNQKQAATLNPFARQFPLKMIKELGLVSRKLPEVEEILSVGKTVPGAIVVYSDIKNFSTLVRVCKPDHLNECMKAYYSQVRELVWKHNGVLDKFIGDASLVIFNYPQTDEKSYDTAIAFADELIQIGRAILNDLTDNMNEIVEVGTRVGIACGPLWVLNIGVDHPEFTFIGNTINLAARLESNAPVNSLKICHITHKNLKTENRKRIWEQQELAEDKVKGQLTKIKCWQPK